MDDLRADPVVPDTSDLRLWRRTGLAVVAPRLDVARFIEAEDDAEALKGAFLGQLLRTLRLPCDDREAHFIDRGAAGAALALQLATQWIAQGKIDRLLIIAVDSYLDPLSLEWLLDHGRLKSPSNAMGLMPGEAGACMIVEAMASAKSRRTPVHAVIEAAATDHEANHFFSGQPNTGIALTRAIRAAGTTASLPQGRFEGDIILDLNGESWRAAEWGHARVRLSDIIGDRTRTILPCSSVGDIGAASSLLGVGIAARSFARGYASGSRALVSSSSEHGDVGAILVRADR